MGVMNIKGGTQTFSRAEQMSGLKADGNQALDAAQMRELNGQSVGDVLNKVADPNWVDPAKLRKVGNNQLDKDAFLKLMLAQMKHQDPTNPMQSHEMAAQLAQFTSLEQLNNINTTLESMKATQSPAVNYQTLNFIGKKVSGDSSKIIRVAGDKGHDINFNLLGDASKVKVVVKDAEGNPVRSFEYHNMKKGSNAVAWNGMDDDGVAARPGDYKVAIEAESSNGAKVFAKTEFDGRITGVNYTPSGPVLLIGQQTVRLQDVKKIVEAGPEDVGGAIPLMPQATGAGTPAGSPSASGASPSTGGAAPSAAPAPGAPADATEGEVAKDEDVKSNMKKVAMSRGVMNQLAKANAK